jgi:NAD(P)H-nitrite reductase large subunit
VQDSTSFAIRIEERYKGLRAPHKMKSAVSGCVRECAEAQGKDFGLIATEKGWNVFVCGNGGASPRHADLLVADVDEATAVRLIDRFLMFYIRTADRLTRTSVWLDKMRAASNSSEDRRRRSLGIAADPSATCRSSSTPTQGVGRCGARSCQASLFRHQRQGWRRHRAILARARAVQAGRRVAAS